MEHKCECKRSEWGDMVIGSCKKGNLYWFRFWCKHIPGHEDEPMPVFSADYRDAIRFTYVDMANAVKDKIEKDFNDHDLFVAPASLLASRGGRNFLKFMYGPDPEDDTDGDEIVVES